MCTRSRLLKSMVLLLALAPGLPQGQGLPSPTLPMATPAVPPELVPVMSPNLEPRAPDALLGKPRPGKTAGRDPALLCDRQRCSYFCSDREVLTTDPALHRSRMQQCLQQCFADC
jgi:hypothetical protein